MKVSWFLKEALISLRRNWVMSLAAISTVALSLLVVGIFAFVALSLEQIITNLERQVEVEAFLEDGATFNEIQVLQDKIISWEEVKKLDFISKDKALEIFKERFKDQPDMLKGLTSDVLPASFKISLKDPHDAKSVAGRLKREGIVEDVTYGADVAERLFVVGRVLRWVGLIFILVLGFASLSLIAITIRLAIFARRHEVAIMRLVGASNWFIRLPFLFEGMAQGLLGAVLAGGGLYLLKRLFFEQVVKLLAFLPITMDSRLFINVNLGLLVAGLCIGALGSTIALRRFLKV
jgi:cell division transport system permease protein